MQKVLIIGLRSIHYSKVIKAFPEVNFKILTDQVTNHVSALDQISNYDYVFTMTNFTNHKIDVKCKKHENFTRVSGAFSSLMQILKATLI